MYEATKDLPKAKLKVNKGEWGGKPLRLPEAVSGINQGAAPSPGTGLHHSDEKADSSAAAAAALHTICLV